MTLYFFSLRLGMNLIFMAGNLNSSKSLGFTNAGNDSSGENGIVLIIQYREKEKTVVSAFLCISGLEENYNLFVAEVEHLICRCSC